MLMEAFMKFNINFLGSVSLSTATYLMSVARILLSWADFITSDNQYIRGLSVISAAGATGEVFRIVFHRCDIVTWDFTWSLGNTTLCHDIQHLFLKPYSRMMSFYQTVVLVSSHSVIISPLLMIIDQKSHSTFIKCFWRDLKVLKYILCVVI